MWDETYQGYGPRNVWKPLQREGFRVARCTVGRLLRAMGLRGAVRGRAWITTTHAGGHDALAGLVHHSDQGVQSLSMRYTDRLADAGFARSVGSGGDAYDNALAESVIGLFKTEVIQRKGRGVRSRLPRSPRSCGSTGSTIGGCSGRSGKSHGHPTGRVRSAVLCPGQGGLIQRIRSPTFPVRFK